MHELWNILKPHENPQKLRDLIRLSLESPSENDIKKIEEKIKQIPWYQQAMAFESFVILIRKNGMPQAIDAFNKLCQSYYENRARFSEFLQENVEDRIDKTVPCKTIPPQQPNLILSPIKKSPTVAFDPFDFANAVIVVLKKHLVPRNRGDGRGDPMWKVRYRAGHNNDVRTLLSSLTPDDLPNNPFATTQRTGLTFGIPLTWKKIEFLADDYCVNHSDSHRVIENASYVIQARGTECHSYAAVINALFSMTTISGADDYQIHQIKLEVWGEHPVLYCMDFQCACVVSKKGEGNLNAEFKITYRNPFFVDVLTYLHARFGSSAVLLDTWVGEGAVKISDALKIFSQPDNKKPPILQTFQDVYETYKEIKITSFIDLKSSGYFLDTRYYPIFRQILFDLNAETNGAVQWQSANPENIGVFSNSAKMSASLQTPSNTVSGAPDTIY